MPRGTTLTDYEKTKIKIYRECGLSNSSITKEIGRSRNLINNFFSLCENYSKMKRTDRIPLYHREINEQLRDLPLRNPCLHLKYEIN